VNLRVGLNQMYSIIYNPFPRPSHGGPHFANLSLIWRYLSWIRMGTLELCPMWDIYGERRNLSEDYGRDKVFLGIVKFHTMSTNVQEMSKLGCFECGKWIMDYGISRLRPTLSWRNRTGDLRITKFVKSRAPHHWAKVTDESPEIPQDPLSNMESQYSHGGWGHATARATPSNLTNSRCKVEEEVSCLLSTHTPEACGPSGPGRGEGTGTRPDYLVNRNDTKIEGPFGGKNCTDIEKYLSNEQSELWVHRDSWLRAQICSFLEPNTNAQDCCCCHMYCAHLCTSLQ